MGEHLSHVSHFLLTISQCSVLAPSNQRRKHPFQVSQSLPASTWSSPSSVKLDASCTWKSTEGTPLPSVPLPHCHKPMLHALTRKSMKGIPFPSVPLPSCHKPILCSCTLTIIGENTCAKCPRASSSPSVVEQTFSLVQG